MRTPITQSLEDPDPAAMALTIDVEESTAGLMRVLESGRPLNGRFYSYKGEETPW